MRVGLLGPLEVTGPGGRVRIGAAKERLVLALLILRAGQVVARDALVDALWADRPPATAVKTLQGHVARVRRALEAVGIADILTTRPPGYLLCVPAESLDTAGFERHASKGHAALVAGDASRATAELRDALALWRGDALADCRGGGWAETEAVRLDERRLTTVEDRIDADLMLGHHGVLVGELESLVARYPLRERLWAALMLALYRSGRQADAVRGYQRARDVLVGELGLEPGAQLRRIEAAVLAGDPALDAPESVGPGTELAIPLPRRIETASSAVFVGRAREREALADSFRAVAAGARRAVLISGEPGIGKTSLAAAFAREAPEHGAVVVYGRCDEGLGIPYQPWAEILAHLVAHLPDDVLATHVDARGRQLERLAPDLAGRAPAARPSSGDAGSERYLLFGAVVDLLVRVSALAPVVLVIDDLQWADSPTVQLLQQVLSADSPLRLLVIGTFRDSDVATDHPLADALAALHREPGIERIMLQGLGDDEILTLVETTARHARAEEGLALRDALSAETDGNPFFVGEMLRNLAETRAIYQDEHGSWLASPDLRALGLPVSIREVIGRRVARLGADTEGALSLAAVIGRDFDAGVVAWVAGLDEDTLIDRCDEAVTAAVLTASDQPGRYTFAHALIEHALYDDLSSGRRGRAHRRVAEALEDLCGDDPVERIGELAYHWANASPPDATKAIAYAQRAGDRALAQLAPDEALRWYRDALALLNEEPHDDPRRRAALLLGFGDAQRQLGDPAHRETLLAAGHLADDVDAIDTLVRSALRNNRGWNSIVGGVDRERVEMLARALARLGDTDSPDRARLLAMSCVELTWDADFDERLSMANEAVGIARRTGDPAALVDAIRLCHESIAMPETLVLRRRWITEACDLAADLGDPTARLHANDFRLLDALEAGDPATMRTARAAFESESDRIGQPLNRWQIAYHGAWQGMLDGDLDAAAHSASEALTFGTAAGYPEDAATIYRYQLMCLRWMQGRLSTRRSRATATRSTTPGRQIFQVTLAFMKSYDDAAHDEVRHLLDTEVAEGFPMSADATWLVADVLWADAIHRTGHQAAAEAMYERLLPWHDQFATSHITVHGGVAHYLGLLSHTLSRHDEADRWFGQALAFHEALAAPFFVALTQAAWADLLTDRGGPGDRCRAQALAGAAASLARERGYGSVARDAGVVLDRTG